MPGINPRCGNALPRQHPPCQDQLRAAPMGAEASVPGQGTRGYPACGILVSPWGCQIPSVHCINLLHLLLQHGSSLLSQLPPSVPGIIVNSSPKHSCSGQWDTPVHDGGSPRGPALGWLPVTNTTNIPFSHGDHHVPSSPSDGSA